MSTIDAGPAYRKKNGRLKMCSLAGLPPNQDMELHVSIYDWQSPQRIALSIFTTSLVAENLSLLAKIAKK